MSLQSSARLGPETGLCEVKGYSGRIVGYTEVEIPPVVHRYGKLGTRHVVYM